MHQMVSKYDFVICHELPDDVLACHHIAEAGPPSCASLDNDWWRPVHDGLIRLFSLKVANVPACQAFLSLSHTEQVALMRH
jgi:hypothetical protein